MFDMSTSWMFDHVRPSNQRYHKGLQAARWEGWKIHKIPTGPTLTVGLEKIVACSPAARLSDTAHTHTHTHTNTCSRTHTHARTHRAGRYLLASAQARSQALTDTHTHTAHSTHTHTHTQLVSLSLRPDLKRNLPGGVESVRKVNRAGLYTGRACFDTRSRAMPPKSVSVLAVQLCA